MHESLPVLPNPKLVDEANRLPINQEAKRWLLVAKADLESSALYLLQLILWGLDLKRLPVGDAQRLQLAQAANELLGYQPEKAMKLLLQTPDSESPESNLSVDHLSSQRSPEDAAWQAVQALDRILTEHVSQYPPSHQTL